MKEKRDGGNERVCKKKTGKTKGKSGIPALKDMTPEELELHRRTEIVRMMPDNIAAALASARQKPIWCSDIRWRMELRRRALSRRGIWF